MPRKFRVKIGGKIFEVEVEEIMLETATPTTSPLIPSTEPSISRQEEKPITKTATVVEERERARGIVRAPIPGTIVSIKCREGDPVKKGDPLVVLESMKMENVIYSPTSGRIKRLAVSEGASVNFGDILVEIE